MVFTIESFNKEFDIYTVSSDTNEKRMVTSTQIAQVLAQGYTFTNAFLTRKGFGIQYNKRTKYIQINNMPKQLDAMIVNRLNYLKAEEENKKKQMTEAIKKPTVKASLPTTKSSKNIAQSITSNRNKSIVYKGEVYLSLENLCKSFNRDINSFKELYKKGYSMDECLGLIQPRPESMVTPRKETQRIVESLDKIKTED